MVQVKTNEHKKGKNEKIHFGELIANIELLNYKRMDGNLLVDKNEHFQKMLKVVPKDLFGMTESEQLQAMNGLTHFCRLYNEDFSFTSLMFPASTDEQQVFWRSRLEDAKMAQDMYRLKLCNEQIANMIWVEKNIENEAFILWLYANTKEEMENLMTTVKMTQTKYWQTVEMENSEIEAVLHKMNNMNTSISF